MNEKVVNPNDYKVVSFHNSTDFGFTPEMGCMYDGRNINGALGGPGIRAGETMVLPYHVGKQLSINLAKVSFNRKAPAVDPAGIPTGVPLWDKTSLDNLAASFLKELYTEQRPVAQSETERLLAKVEELNRWKESMEAKNNLVSNTPENVVSTPNTVSGSVGYQDKAEVIAELNKRGIKFDARQNKANLEKLLA